MATTKRHPAHESRAIGANAGRPAHRHGVRGRLQHRRLCLLGPDGRQPRAGARLRTLLRAPLPRETRAVHTNLVPAGAFRGFGVPQSTIAQEQLFDELARAARPRPARIPDPQRADRRRPPTVTGQVLGAGVGIKACLEALRPHWRGPRRGGSLQRGARGRCGAASASPACGMAAATPRMPNPSTIRLGLKRDGRLVAPSGRGRYRPGLQHRHPADLRRRAGRAARAFDLRFGRHRPHARLRQDLGLAPDLRHRQGGASSPARALARRDPAPCQCRRGRGARLRRWPGHRDRGRRGAKPRPRRFPARSRGLRVVGGGDLRSADHGARRERPGLALCGLWLRRASGRGRGRYAISAP